MGLFMNTIDYCKYNYILEDKRGRGEHFTIFQKNFSKNLFEK